MKLTQQNSQNKIELRKKFHRKRVFRIFHILKLKKIDAVFQLFMERPS